MNYHIELDRVYKIRLIIEKNCASEGDEPFAKSGKHGLAL